jgi:hypothetical protein
MEQLEAVLAWRPEVPLVRPALVYCDFEDVRRYREAVERARAAGLPVGLATLRIVKPGEEGFLKPLARLGADVLLVRNLAALTLYWEMDPKPVLVGDFSLNVTNELTAGLLAGEGLARLVPSHDLNWEQLAALVGQIDPGLFEVVVHQHMPMFRGFWLTTRGRAGILKACDTCTLPGPRDAHRCLLLFEILLPPAVHGRLDPPADGGPRKLARRPPRRAA